MKCVKQRLYTVSIPYREQLLRAVIPNCERVLAAQAMDALRPEIFVQMQCDLAVGASAETMAAVFEIILHTLVVVELSVRNDPRTLVFVRYRLSAGLECNP